MLVLNADDLSFSYDNKTDCINHVSLSLSSGEMAVILGSNGSGKSTLARLLSGLASPDSGSVSYYGIKKGEERQRISIVFQNPDNQFSESTVTEELGFICRNFRICDAEEKIVSALRDVGLSGFQKRDPSTLSGGEKVRLLLASAIIRDPAVLILDETFSMLDHSASSACISLINRLRREKQIAVLLITHNTAEALDSDIIYILEKGRIAESGIPDGILRNPDILSCYGISPLPATGFAFSLKRRLSPLPLTDEELLEAICS